MRTDCATICSPTLRVAPAGTAAIPASATAMTTRRSTTPAKGSRRSGGWNNDRLLVEIDSGYDFRVVVVDDAWVFRLPRRPGVVPSLEAEVALLPVLEAALPVEVPRFELVSPEPPFVAYRLLRGMPLVDEDGDGVRAFLEALH